MDYFKIRRGNRYCSQYDELIKIISLSNYFEEFYNDDKNSSCRDYRKPKKTFSIPVVNSKQSIKQIDDFFKSNLFNVNEKKLLIYNLLISMETYGSNAIFKIIYSSSCKEKAFSKYNIKTNREISEQMVFNELLSFPQLDREIILNIIEHRKALIEEIKEYDLELKRDIVKQENNKQKQDTKEADIKRDEETDFRFINTFDHVASEKVFNYFYENLVNKKYLSKENLEKYLVLAFQEKKQPMEKFSLENINIGTSREIFYRYYVEIAEKPHTLESEYAKLLGNYFKRFTTKKVLNNFAREYTRARV